EGSFTAGSLLPCPGTHSAEPDRTWRLCPRFQEASGVRVSQQWEDYAMRDFYVEVASEAVHHDVCAIIAPDFRHTDGRIERKFVHRSRPVALALCPVLTPAHRRRRTRRPP